MGREDSRICRWRGIYSLSMNSFLTNSDERLHRLPLFARHTPMRPNQHRNRFKIYVRVQAFAELNFINVKSIYALYAVRNIITKSFSRFRTSTWLRDWITEMQYHSLIIKRKFHNFHLQVKNEMKLTSSKRENLWI